LRVTELVVRAIDLYAGVGGWALGLKMAGITVTDSYEWWKPAIATHDKNLRSRVHECNIRELQLTALPNRVDVVVGSPPCTQFSFSNRGGKGDIEDGLVDIEKFLEVVAYLKPKFWAMENVPRVKEILDAELKEGGRLSRFARLDLKSAIIDMSDFGLPQRRRRCIAGNFDFDLLLSYRDECEDRSLGDVLTALSRAMVVDPNYGQAVAHRNLTDHEPELALNEEEERMNRESKLFHPVNNMAFPDPEEAAVRTITATCTRVSRESVIVRAPENPDVLRRLTVRERATLQGFPISYQFYGKTYAQKLKMVGNALPPLMSFFVAQAMQRIAPGKLISPREAIKSFEPPTERASRTKPDSEGRTYPPNRNFRAAIPNLRFKSGVRFELSNGFDAVGAVHWRCRFYFGNSKDIRERVLDAKLLEKCRRQVVDEKMWKKIAGPLNELNGFVRGLDAQSMQDAWSRRSESAHPYHLVDKAGAAAGRIVAELQGLNRSKLEAFVVEALELSPVMAGGNEAPKRHGTPKVRRFAPSILAGFLVGSTLNFAITQGNGKLKTRSQERAVA
jgi:DNA (cytosine-5)-methyltransferase 1